MKNKNILLQKSQKISVIFFSVFKDSHQYISYQFVLGSFVLSLGVCFIAYKKLMEIQIQSVCSRWDSLLGPIGKQLSFMVKKRCWFMRLFVGGGCLPAAFSGLEGGHIIHELREWGVHLDIFPTSTCPSAPFLSKSIMFSSAQ